MSNFRVVDGLSRHLVLFICVIAILLSSQTYATEENQVEPSKSTAAKRGLSHPHCGLYCLYTVMKLAGENVNFRELVKPEYISSAKGSSIAELRKAAEDNGLHAVPVGMLTSRLVRNCPHPMILHVKSDTTSKEYEHYELLLGIRNGKAEMFNPPEPVRLVSFRELAPRWDGTGLIVSPEPIDLDSILAPARRRLMLHVVVGIVAILMIHWGRRQWLDSADKMTCRRLLGVSVGQAAGFTVAALLLGMTYHFANEEGLLANASATASIQQAHLGNFIPKVSEKKVHKLRDKGTVFIDARYARDFKAGHLDDSINVPVNASDHERRKTTAEIAKDARIVVYCQSAGCNFAERVAIKLMSDGFSDISIFRGGWNEWKAKNGDPFRKTLQTQNWTRQSRT